jgi:uncharacterized Zn ribbon protein
MAKKTFEECKKGDILYLLDLENNLEVKKVKLDKIVKWYGEETYEFELSNKYNVRGCVKARSRCKNLFTTEEEALAFKDSVEKGEKVFYTVKKGDSVYIVFSGENEVVKATFANDYPLKDYLKVSLNGKLISVGSNYGSEALENKLGDCWRFSTTARIYLNEKDAIKSIKDSERRKKKSATDKYLKSIENHDGKPISHTDNLGSALHYGDTVAYIRRIGIHGHPELRKGVVVGESKTTITIVDEDEKKDGKPTGWRREPNKESDGKHSLQPQSVLLFKLAEVNKRSGFILTK